MKAKHFFVVGATFISVIAIPRRGQAPLIGKSATITVADMSGHGSHHQKMEVFQGQLVRTIDVVMHKFVILCS